MYKSCPRCGKIHSTKYKCTKGKVKRVLTDDMRLRNLSAWHKKAEDIKKASKYLCSVCLDKGRYTYNKLEVHHIEKLRDNPERLLDNYNLICLCKNCHKLADDGMIDKDYLYKLAKNRENGNNPQ